MKPFGCPHSDCARCNGTVSRLEARIAELEADKQRLWDSIEAGESVYKRKCDRLEAQNNRLKTICDCMRLVAALEDTD
jgi:histone acetyltransferase (RNA polymerase elongator complex component)